MQTKIVKLTAENVKRLTAVEITPAGNVVQISGKNGAGKSSVLDAIEYAIGGQPQATMPVRRGEEKARIVLDLGDLVVRRTFTAAGGTSLVVTDKEGNKQTSPQSILDKLTGKLTFDPLAFAQQNPKEQGETLRKLVGLDFTHADQAREKTFNERTVVNRELKSIEAKLAGVPRHEGLPAVEQSTSAILEEQAKAAEVNSENANLRNQLSQGRTVVAHKVAAILSMRNEIKSLEEQIKFKQERIAAEQAGIEVRDKENKALEEQIAKRPDVDLAGFAAKLAEVEATNTKIRSNRQREELVSKRLEKQSEAEELTKEIERFDSERRQAIRNAKYPVAGLAFDATGHVVLNEIPFAQASTAEQLKVSVAIGFALNPTLRVLLVRHGNDLDKDSMKLLAEMAKNADGQVWLERVSTDGAAAIVIEDGHIAQPPNMPPQTPDAEGKP